MAQPKKKTLASLKELAAIAETKAEAAVPAVLSNSASALQADLINEINKNFDKVYMAGTAWMHGILAKAFYLFAEHATNHAINVIYQRARPADQTLIRQWVAKHSRYTVTNEAGEEKARFWARFDSKTDNFSVAPDTESRRRGIYDVDTVEATIEPYYNRVPNKRPTKDKLEQMVAGLEASASAISTIKKRFLEGVLSGYNLSDDARNALDILAKEIAHMQTLDPMGRVSEEEKAAA